MKSTLKLTTKNVDTDIKDIITVAEILKNGGIAAIPTETVYGLAADAFNGEAVKKIFEAKGRPQDNPLIVHIADFEQIYSIAREVPESAKKLAERFWPGPLTMILPKKKEIPDETSGGLDTVAIRMPSNPIANKIISLSCPLAAPSANISGFPSPTAFGHVEADMMGRADAICDGGDCGVGVESTVITLVPKTPVLLRPGGITAEQLREVLGEVEIDSAVLNPMKDGETAASPGMKYKHYSPKAEVTVLRGTLSEFIDYTNKSSADAVMCFEGEEKYFPDKITVSFGKKEDSPSQARRLFDALRELDEKGARCVFARSPSKKGVGLAVCNRLYRSAAFRFENAFTRPIIGLTGPTGAGKGYVTEKLRQLGCFVVDTDKVARELTEKNSPVLSILAENFGKDIINDDGSLNRRALAKKAFSDKESQLRLNAIMHPEIIKTAKERCIDALDEGASAAVIDAPLLFECGADSVCEKIITVIAPKELRLKRIIERDGISEEEAERRMSAQHEDGFYTSKADFVIRSYAPFSVDEELTNFKNYLTAGE